MLKTCQCTSFSWMGWNSCFIEQDKSYHRSQFQVRIQSFKKKTKRILTRRIWVQASFFVVTHTREGTCTYSKMLFIACVRGLLLQLCTWGHAWYHLQEPCFRHLHLSVMSVRSHSMEQEKHFGVIVHDWDPEKWQAEEHLWEAWRHCVKKTLGGCFDSTAAGSQEDDAAELSWRSSP